MLFRLFHSQSGVDAISKEREILDGPSAPFKEYPRFPQHSLPTPRPYTMPLQKAAEKRASTRDFSGDTSIPLADLSDILHLACGLNTGRKDTAIPHRYHPSGGALYPIECYVGAYRVEGIPEAIYHYAPRSHALEQLTFVQKTAALLDAPRNLVPSEDPAVAVVFTSVWGRNYPKYGEFAYRLSLIEAGHSMQNLLLAATASGVGACAFSGMRDHVVKKTLDLSKDAEDPIYMAYLGL